VIPPVPEPLTVVVSAYEVGGAGTLNSATAEVNFCTVTVQGFPWPEQAPNQRVNVWPLAAFAVSVTAVPFV